MVATRCDSPSQIGNNTSYLQKIVGTQNSGSFKEKRNRSQPSIDETVSERLERLRITSPKFGGSKGRNSRDMQGGCRSPAPLMIRRTKQAGPFLLSIDVQSAFQSSPEYTEQSMSVPMAPRSACNPFPGLIASDSGLLQQFLVYSKNQV
ncbi:hypothetical protein GUITHDRAFT_152457 [Guillardia theta CCMP2712]|uniref:Uncharacterized protein n=2 Tax=Guillardia theta TaxID=55529 RepID=L1JDF7_GUITC|nr:hypothetical protein GUITHDRAFT_152457 [Guillardia theta CCMP2712]EKX46307.1 hypothetical protein GUITHDRAFT_152457 [Guillardia theta CCMP2712]|mmetsp:Transcript_31217/g.100160  ORF Transcript_31217/g.100160 Transcript_31217/m.100160 type:complete len:149 (+) Transcript_31217:241-687(+)|eukprot:XP_005833287.1 hypothetical protein GUITHDRAFT_152457 [Guillardia theta CCMP2712]